MRAKDGMLLSCRKMDVCCCSDGIPDALALFAAPW